MPWYRVTLRAQGWDTGTWIFQNAAMGGYDPPDDPKEMDKHLQEVWEWRCHRAHDWTDHASHSFGGECTLEDPPREFLLNQLRGERRRLRNSAKSIRATIKRLKEEAEQATSENIVSNFRCECWQGPDGGCGNKFEGFVKYGKDGYPKKLPCPKCKKLAQQHGPLSKVLPSSTLTKVRRGRAT